MESLLNNFKKNYNLEFFDCNEKKFLDILKKNYVHLHRDPIECFCNDVLCPHKTNINPVSVFLLRKELENCFSFKKNILENLHFNSIEIQNVESISSKFNPYIPDETKIPINNLYNRFMFPIKFDKHGDILLFKGTLSILEGFYFENDCVDKIIVDFNGNRLEFFKNRDYFLNSFPILYDCLSYTQIIFEFYKNGKLVDITNQNGKMIGGFLPKTINCDYCFINDKVKYSDGCIYLF